jgi:DHA2 family multidrug resistance protein-like MFS transporter
MAAGFAVGAIGMLLLTQVEAGSGLAILVAASVIYSLGFAPLFTLTNDIIIGTAPPERAGAASGISETGAELGGALSIAVLGTLGTAIYRRQVDDDIPAAVPADSAETARDTLGGALAESTELPADVGAALLSAAREAFTQGLQVVAVVSAVLAALGAVGIAAFLRNARLTSATKLPEVTPLPAPAVEPE